MEPTDDELQRIESLEAAYNWAGVPEDVRETLGRSLGTPSKIRDIVFIDRTTWDAVVAALKGLGPAGTDPRPERDLTPIDKARIEIFRRVCFKRVGATPDTPGAALTTPATAVAAGPSALTGVGGSRKLKLSAVIDQTLDAEVIALAGEEINKMYEAYRTKFGDVPSPEAEPTADQLSAARQLIASGATPYFDFSVFGPHGLRLLRKLTFSSFSLNSMGEWARRELPGPPDFEAWFAIFRCMRTTLLLLEAASSERMDGYSEHIRALHLRFGQGCWDLIYTADVHMRSEQFERIRRRLTVTPEHGFTAATTWNAVFAQAVREDQFWTKEVVTPSTLRLAQGKPGQHSSGGQGSGPLMSKLDKETDSPGPKKKRAKVTDANDKSQHDGQVYTHNRRGMRICPAWNQGRCGKSDKPQSKCDDSASHQCNLCLGPRQAKVCKKPK
eukprot:Skav216040  [mRNA]  locus=scaffold2930:33502:34827:+ [translate_table: standard]